MILEGIPHVSDEIAYLFQARVFAAGHLSLPAPALASFFPAEWVVTHQGRWFAIFPPGWPAILAVGQWLGAPWLVNPALTALALVVVHALARELIGREAALGVTLLCAASPFFLFMGASAMSHPAALIFTAGCVLALVRATARGSRWWFVASGACAACAVLVRPLDALVVWGGAALALLARARTRRQFAGTVLSAAALAPGVAAYVLYDRALSGRWLVPLLELTGASNRLGFGADVGQHGHDFWQAALNLNFNLAVLGADMLGWPVSSLCFAVGLLAFGRLASAHRLMITVVAAYCAVYALYWYHGVCFGARLYFTLLPFFLMLTVDGIRAAGQAFGASRVGLFVALCFGFAVAVYWPVMSLVRPYRHFRDVDQGLRAFMCRAAGRSRGRVRGSEHVGLRSGPARQRARPDGRPARLRGGSGRRRRASYAGRFADRPVLRLHPSTRSAAGGGALAGSAALARPAQRLHLAFRFAALRRAPAVPSQAHSSTAPYTRGYASSARQPAWMPGAK